MIIYGIAKKFIVADNVALHANAVFVEGEHLANIGLIWWATLCFGIQIYCDFSHIQTSAIGSAHILGITLLREFQNPICSNLASRLLAKMAYFVVKLVKRLPLHPTGGSRNGVNRMIFALMMTMLLGGLWHGASWNFILWGFVHGLLLIVHRFGKDIAL